MNSNQLNPLFKSMKHHPSISLKVFTCNFFKEKAYVIFNQEKECIIIDPGCNSTVEQEQLSSFLKVNALVVKHLLNTHAHIDHICGNHYVKTTYNVKLAMHIESLPLLAQVGDYQEQYGFTGYQATDPDLFLAEGDSVSIAGCTLSVIYVPGHAPGHLAFYNETLKICFSGDVLFKGSIGRTDLWGGNGSGFLHSIRTKLFALPDDVVIYSGHGETTTIGAEKKHNPYLR